MRYQGVDIAQLIFHHSVFNEYDFTGHYAGDSILIDKIYIENPQWFSYIPKELCYYNYLETIPKAKVPKVLLINKGEQIILCLRNNDKLVDINTLFFVVLHEFAHLATESIGHTEEFWDNFRWILEEAMNIGLYIKQEFKIKNVEYCGMTITSSPIE